MSRQLFLTIHRDLMTEVTLNSDAKGCRSLMMDGYSTSEQKNYAFDKTSHVIAKVRSKIKQHVDMLPSCIHKELSPRFKKYYDNIITDMNEKILECCDPFLNAPTHHLKLRVEKMLTKFTKFVEESMETPEEETIDCQHTKIQN